MPKKLIGHVLLLLAAISAIAGLATLLPWHAEITNDFGYKSLCPFAPWSSLILLATGGVLWVVRQYIFTRVE